MVDTLDEDIIEQVESLHDDVGPVSESDLNADVTPNVSEASDVLPLTSDIEPSKEALATEIQQSAQNTADRLNPFKDENPHRPLEDRDIYNAAQHTWYAAASLRDNELHEVIGKIHEVSPLEGFKATPQTEEIKTLLEQKVAERASSVDNQVETLADLKEVVEEVKAELKIELERRLEEVTEQRETIQYGLDKGVITVRESLDKEMAVKAVLDYQAAKQAENSPEFDAKSMIGPDGKMTQEALDKYFAKDEVVDAHGKFQDVAPAPTPLPDHPNKVDDDWKPFDFPNSNVAEGSELKENFAGEHQPDIDWQLEQDKTLFDKMMERLPSMEEVSNWWAGNKEEEQPLLDTPLNPFDPVRDLEVHDRWDAIVNEDLGAAREAYNELMQDEQIKEIGGLNKSYEEVKEQFQGYLESRQAIHGDDVSYSDIKELTIQAIKTDALFENRVEELRKEDEEFNQQLNNKK